MNGGGLCWCYDFFESLDDFASYNIWTMLPRLIGRFNVRVGGGLDILRGFRRGFLGQGPKCESNLELLGRQAGACLHLHPYPLRWTIVIRETSETANADQGGLWFSEQSVQTQIMILVFGVSLIVNRPVYGSWGGDNLFLNASDWTYTFESS